MKITDDQSKEAFEKFYYTNFKDCSTSKVLEHLKPLDYETWQAAITFANSHKSIELQQLEEIVESQGRSIERQNKRIEELESKQDTGE